MIVRSLEMLDPVMTIPPEFGASTPLFWLMMLFGPIDVSVDALISTPPSVFWLLPLLPPNWSTPILFAESVVLSHPSVINTPLRWDPPMTLPVSVVPAAP